MIAVFVDNKGFKRTEVLPRLLDHYFFYEGNGVFAPIADSDEIAGCGFMSRKVKFRPYRRVVGEGDEMIWEYRQV